MPSKNKPLTDAELDVYEAGRDLAADILQSIAEMKAGQVKPVDTSAIEARMKTANSESKCNDRMSGEKRGVNSLTH